MSDQGTPDRPQNPDVKKTPETPKPGDTRTPEQKEKDLTGRVNEKLKKAQKKAKELPPKFRDQLDSRVKEFVQKKLTEKVGEEEILKQLDEIFEKFGIGLEQGKQEGDTEKKEQEEKLKSLGEEMQELQGAVENKGERLSDAAVNLEALRKNPNLTPEQVQQALAGYQQRYQEVQQSGVALAGIVKEAGDVKRAFDEDVKAGGLNTVGAGTTIGTGAAAGAAIGSVVPGLGTAIGAGLGAAIGAIGYFGARCIHHAATAAENKRKAAEANKAFENARREFTVEQTKIAGAVKNMENAGAVLQELPDEARDRALKQFGDRSEQLAQIQEEIVSGQRKVREEKVKLQTARTQAERDQEKARKQGTPEQQAELESNLALVEQEEDRQDEHLVVLEEAEQHIVGQGEQEREAFEQNEFDLSAFGGEIATTLLDQGLHIYLVEDNVQKQGESLKILKAETPGFMENTWSATFEGFSKACKAVFKDGIAEHLKDWTKDIPVLEQVGGLVAGLSGGVAGIGEGIGTMLAHPVDTAKGMSALAGLHSEISAGEAWKQMGKAIISYDKFARGDISEGIGEVGFNVITTLATGGTAAGVKTAAQASVFAAGLSTKLAAATSMTSRLAVYGKAVAMKPGIFIRQAGYGLGSNIAKLPGKAAKFGKVLVNAPGNILRAPGAIARYARQSRADRLGSKLAGVNEGIAGVAKKLDGLGVDAKSIEDLARLAPDELSAKLGLNPSKFTAREFNKYKNIETALAEHKVLKARDTVTRLQLAEEVLGGKKLSDVEQKAILKAHEHGTVVDGKYSPEEVMEKFRILRGEGGFTKEQAHILLNRWVTGNMTSKLRGLAGSAGRNTLYYGTYPALYPLQLLMGALGGVTYPLRHPWKSLAGVRQGFVAANRFRKSVTGYLREKHAGLKGAAGEGKAADVAENATKVTEKISKETEAAASTAKTAEKTAAPAMPEPVEAPKPIVGAPKPVETQASPVKTPNHAESSKPVVEGPEPLMEHGIIEKQRLSNTQGIDDEISALETRKKNPLFQKRDDIDEVIGQLKKLRDVQQEIEQATADMNNALKSNPRMGAVAGEAFEEVLGPLRAQRAELLHGKPAAAVKNTKTSVSVAPETPTPVPTATSETPAVAPTTSSTTPPVTAPETPAAAASATPATPTPARRTTSTPRQELGELNLSGRTPVRVNLGRKGLSTEAYILERTGDFYTVLSRFKGKDNVMKWRIDNKAKITKYGAARPLGIIPNVASVPLEGIPIGKAIYKGKQCTVRIIRNDDGALRFGYQPISHTHPDLLKKTKRTPEPTPMAKRDAVATQEPLSQLKDVASPKAKPAAAADHMAKTEASQKPQGAKRTVVDLNTVLDDQKALGPDGMRGAGIPVPPEKPVAPLQPTLGPQTKPPPASSAKIDVKQQQAAAPGTSEFKAVNGDELDALRSVNPDRRTPVMYAKKEPYDSGTVDAPRISNPNSTRAEGAGHTSSPSRPWESLRKEERDFGDDLFSISQNVPPA